MDERSAQIATICECIGHCFALTIWCDDFTMHADPEDMMWGLDNGFGLVSDAARLQSFLALRKLDDFLSSAKSSSDDFTAADLDVDATSVLGDVGDKFLSKAERDNINKGVAHLTENLALDRGSEVDLQAILNRSMPFFSRLAAELRKADDRQEAVQWLNKADALIERGVALQKSWHARL